MITYSLLPLKLQRRQAASAKARRESLAGRVKLYWQVAKKVIFSRVLKNVRTQVEFYEIPLAGACEILRNETYLDVRRSEHSLVNIPDRPW